MRDFEVSLGLLQAKIKALSASIAAQPPTKLQASAADLPAIDARIKLLATELNNAYKWPSRKRKKARR